MCVCVSVRVSVCLSHISALSFSRPPVAALHGLPPQQFTAVELINCS